MSSSALLLRTQMAESRKAVAEQFGISAEQVSKIEREGLEKEWPPL